MNSEHARTPLDVDTAAITAWNADIARSRVEYRTHPSVGVTYGGEPRTCIDCGKTHRQRFTAYCSRCRRKPRERR